MLKLISIWDSKQGAVDPNQYRTETPQETPSAQITVREPTDAEREALAEGTVEKETLIEAISADALVTEPDRSTHSARTEYERRMAEITAEVYVLRDEYIATLEHMYLEAEQALTGLKAGDGGAEETASLISHYLSRATELELRCDGQIDEIAAEMETLIRDNGGDMTPVDTLIETYATEKAAKKAWYMERLEEKGLIS